MSPGQAKRKEFEDEALAHSEALYRFSLHLTGNENDALDLAQECLWQAFRKFDQFQRGTNCKAWLFRIAKNLHIDRMRQKARSPRTVELQETLLRGRTDDSEAKTLLHWGKLATDGGDALLELFGDEVTRTLQELPWEFRTAVILCDVEEFSYQEISAVLECPIGTVRSRISRARLHLKEKLHEYANEFGFVKPSGGES